MAKAKLEDTLTNTHYKLSFATIMLENAQMKYALCEISYEKWQSLNEFWRSDVELWKQKVRDIESKIVEKLGQKYLDKINQVD